MKASIATLILAAVAQVSALGINCRGSSNCGLVHDDRLQQIHDGLKARGGSDFFGNGQHIYCVGSFCAFYQNIPSNQLRNTQDALNHLQNLLDHGCKVCGSDPTGSNNDVSTGELTVNYVSNP